MVHGQYSNQIIATPRITNARDNLSVTLTPLALLQTCPISNIPRFAVNVTASSYVPPQRPQITSSFTMTCNEHDVSINANESAWTRNETDGVPVESENVKDTKLGDPGFNIFNMFRLVEIIKRGHSTFLEKHVF